MNEEWLITWEEEYPDGHTSEEQYIVGAASSCGDALRLFTEQRPLSLIVEIRNLRVQATREV